MQADFPEVPDDMLAGEWVSVSSSTWRSREHIPLLEARAALWSLKHALRDTHAQGHRMLFFVDAMSIVLMLAKG
eukprot:11609529-Heterocapsa_arctica.AAC.1